MKVLQTILTSEKCNLNKVELVKRLEDEISSLSIITKFNPSIKYCINLHIISLILDEIKTQELWSKNELKNLFLDKILNNL